MALHFKSKKADNIPQKLWQTQTIEMIQHFSQTQAESLLCNLE